MVAGKLQWSAKETIQTTNSRTNSKVVCFKNTHNNLCLVWCLGTTQIHSVTNSKSPQCFTYRLYDVVSLIVHVLEQHSEFVFLTTLSCCACYYLHAVAVLVIVLDDLTKIIPKV